MGILSTFRCNALSAWLLSGTLMMSACAQVSVPDARTAEIPTPKYADSRKKAVNERPDSVMYLPLGEDVLVPEVQAGNYLPMDQVGPFELRGETVAGALQLITADYDVSLAFETEEALSRRITVANMRGPLHTIVNRVCGLADLYCSYEDGILIVKDTQIFTVTLPPIGGSDEETEFLDDVIEGLGAILGDADAEPIADPTTRTIVYSATQRTADIASRYFQRLRANTAMIVFETYIWQVQLNAGNSTGIDWERFQEFGKFNTSIGINGSIDSDFTNPVSIGLPTTQDIGATPSQLVQFLAQFGAVKSISQPQISVLSGSQAELRVADTENFVSEISTTIDEGQATTSVSTDSVDSGFELSIGSSWDKSTVYANIELSLTNVIDILDFTFSDSGDDTGTDTTIQLPQTSERELQTNIRVRPGDSFLIAGLVTEDDNFSSRGPGVMKPLLPDSRTATVDNLELVVLMRPRVIVYAPEDDYRYRQYVESKKSKSIAPFLKSDVGAVVPAEPIAPIVAIEPVMPVVPVSPVSSPVASEAHYSNTYSGENLVTPMVEPAPIVEDYSAPVPVIPSEPMVSSSVDVIEPVVPAPVLVEPATISAPVPNAPAPKMSQQIRPASGRLGGGYVSRSIDLDVPDSAASLPTPTSTPAPAIVRSDFTQSEPIDLQNYDFTDEPSLPVSDALPEIDGAIIVSPEFTPEAPQVSSSAQFKRSDIDVVPMAPSDLDSDAQAYYPSQPVYPVSDNSASTDVPAADLRPSSPYDAYDYYVPSTR